MKGHGSRKLYKTDQLREKNVEQESSTKKTEHRVSTALAKMPTPPAAPHAEQYKMPYLAGHFWLRVRYGGVQTEINPRVAENTRIGSSKRLRP